MNYKINYQKGGVKKIIIHIAGPQGSGKTTIGNELKNKYKEKIHMKDFDDLFNDFQQQKIIVDYQKFIDQFISSHSDKPLILVGLDADLCLGPKEGEQRNDYIISTKYKYYIDLDIETNLKQWFYRQVTKLNNRKEWFFENWLQNNDKIQQKLFRFVDINERKRNKTICDELYKLKGYKFMSYDEILQECIDIMKLD